MSWHFSVFAMLMWVEAAILIGVARLVWKRRTSISERLFTALLLAQAIWLICYGLELEGANLATVHFWAMMTYVGIATVPICFFLFVSSYTEIYPKLFRGRLVLLTFVPSLLFLLLVWTNDWHHFFWTSYRLNTTTGPFPYHETIPGPGFWIFTLYAYSVTTWAALILIRAGRGHAPGIHHRHYLFMLISWVLALSTSLLWMSGVWSLQAVDPTPMAIGVALLVIYAVPMGARLFEIMPLARAAVVESLLRAVIVLDVHGRIVDLNPTAVRLLGVSQSQVVGRTPADVFPDADLADIFVGSDEHDREIAFVLAGQTHYLDAHSSPLYDRLGQYRGRVVLLLDITDRKQSELMLEQSEQTLQTLISANEGLVLLTDLQGNLLAFNDRLAALTGLPREAFYGRRVIDLLPEPLARAYSERAASVAVTHQPETWLDLADGRYTDYTLQPVFDRQGALDRFALIARDVTAYKQAELRIRENERILKALIEASTAIVYLCDLQGTLLEFNQNLCLLVGLERETMLNRNVFQLLPPELVDEHARHFQAVVRSGQVARWLVLYEGIYVDNTLHALLDNEGRISRIALIARNVTDYKQTELKLRDNEKVMLALLDASTEVAYLMDTEGNLLAFNQNLCDLVDLSPGEVHGRNVFDLLPPELAESRAVPVGRVISSGQPERWTDLFDGRYMDNSVHPVVGDDGRVDRVAFFSRDISDYIQAGAQIRRTADELEARNRDLDAFARTVAHDLKKPLQGIVGYASLIEMDFSTIAPDLKLFIDSILESAGNMVEMIDNLLLLARLRDAEDVAVRVEPSLVIEAALRRFKQDVSERRIRLTVDEDLPPLLAYGPWLEEVFANLIGNAIKYIGRANPNPEISIRARRVGDVVRCEVQDNGLGISATDQTRLFEQFKRFHHSEASGTGLGLSIVKRIIEKMGGAVGVESLPGEGSTFWFTLPAA